MNDDRIARVAAVLGEVSDQPVLDRLLLLIVELLPVTASAVAVIGDGQHRGTLAVSDPSQAPVDDLQFSLGEGPCLDADRLGRPVLAPDLARNDAWPAFAAAALERGVHAAFALPLRIGAQGLGVLSLYRSSAGDLAGEDLTDAIELSQVVAHVLLDVEADLAPGTIPDRLSELLDQRAVVHQASGMISVQLGLDIAAALSWLRAHAWSTGRAIDIVATEVVARRLRFGPPR